MSPIINRRRICWNLASESSSVPGLGLLIMRYAVFDTCDMREVAMADRGWWIYTYLSISKYSRQHRSRLM